MASTALSTTTSQQRQGAGRVNKYRKAVAGPEKTPNHCNHCRFWCVPTTAPKKTWSLGRSEIRGCGCSKQKPSRSCREKKKSSKTKEKEVKKKRDRSRGAFSPKAALLQPAGFVPAPIEDDCPRTMAGPGPNPLTPPPAHLSTQLAGDRWFRRGSSLIALRFFFFHAPPLCSAWGISMAIPFCHHHERGEGPRVAASGCIPGMIRCWRSTA